MFPIIETPDELKWVDYLINGLVVVVALGLAACFIRAFV